MKDLTLLGNSKTVYPQCPEDAVLECFDNKHQDRDYLVPFVCTEFTSLCPRTHQPDFGTFEILYVPKVKMVESKSLKLYLFSFRNEGSFHEDVTNRIFNDLWHTLKPKYLRVWGNFNVRGGIAIKPLVEKYAKGVDKQAITNLVTRWDNMKR